MPAASTSGFCTPPSGKLSGRLAVSAMEGDHEGVRPSDWSPVGSVEGTF